MLTTVSMFVGLVVGVALIALTRKNPTAAVWIALVLGAIALIVLVGALSGWILPQMGLFGAMSIALLSGVATALALGCIIRGERTPLNWIALVVSAPPVLFLVVFGIGELLGPPH